MASSDERWPDFLIIGAAKAGTTALFKAIARHPQICVALTKEPRYFAFPGARPQFPCPGGEHAAAGIVWDTQEYLALYGKWLPGQRSGEASTTYLMHPEAPANAHARVPDARLIAILRHPVDRAYSHWLHQRHQGMEEFSDFEEALAAEHRRRELGWRQSWQYRPNGCYGSQLQGWLQYYPREQLLILFYDDWKADPQGLLRQVFAHIGVDPNVPVAVTRENVSSMQPRWSWLHHQLVRDSALRRWTQRNLPPWIGSTVTKSVNSVNLAQGPRLDPSLRNQLAAGFHAEIDIVEAITGRDLRHWRSQA